VIDGESAAYLCQFGERCDRWAAGLARLGVTKGDRVATIAPNTHQHLEQFYAIPQLGAVIVPMNYRLTAEDFVYMAAHSGAKVLCAHSDYLDTIDGVRARMPGVRHFVALEGGKPNWLAYESLLERSADAIDPTPSSRRTCFRSITRAVRPRAQRRHDHPPQRVDEFGGYAGALADDTRPTAICGRCRCSMRTAGRSPGR
jgi:acyl-CoA synthetase (AMP-forming)/AMP-acid ligase II